MSRATIYRHFEGGRPQLIRETVTREVARFWADLADAVRSLPRLEDRLVAGMMLAQERLQTNDLLQRLVAVEPEEFLPALFESEPLVHLVVRDYLPALLAAEDLAAGLDARGGRRLPGPHAPDPHRQPRPVGHDRRGAGPTIGADPVPGRGAAARP